MVSDRRRGLTQAVAKYKTSISRFAYTITPKLNLLYYYTLVVYLWLACGKILQLLGKLLGKTSTFITAGCSQNAAAFNNFV